MECKNAYRKNGVKYLLCKKIASPDPKDGQAVAHAMCGHQRWCPHISNCAMLPSWVSCTRLKENEPVVRKEAAENEMDGAEGEVYPQKKRNGKKRSEAREAEE